MQLFPHTSLLSSSSFSRGIPLSQLGSVALCLSLSLSVNFPLPSLSLTSPLLFMQFYIDSLRTNSPPPPILPQYSMCLPAPEPFSPYPSCLPLCIQTALCTHNNLYSCLPLPKLTLLLLFLDFRYLCLNLYLSLCPNHSSHSAAVSLWFPCIPS